MTLLNRKFRINGFPTVLTATPVSERELEVRCSVDYNGARIEARAVVDRFALTLARDPEDIIEYAAERVIHACVASIRELSKP